MMDQPINCYWVISRQPYMIGNKEHNVMRGVILLFD